MTILITGGAGYIGSHCALEILKRGFKLVIFDNLSTGHLETIEKLKTIGEFDFIQGDLKNKEEIDEVFNKFKIDIVFHFASYSQVNESIKEPQKYYINNVLGAINLFDSMIENKVKKIIFSSTAAIYGEPIYVPIDENHPTNPINPYGETKLQIEKYLDEYDKLYNLKSVRLRYFNVAGSNGFVGEEHNPETHLVPNILKASKDVPFCLFGNDYDTKDGTCVRDYIDIEDLIEAHLLAYDYLKKENKTNFFNLGTSKGDTTKEVFDLCQKITNKKINIEIKPRRDGDPAILVADNKKVQEILGWTPKKTLKNSIKSAYNYILMSNKK
ncbi:MAG: UDP-glucose 4-epimerase GalE [Candidatus Gastranaerophilales bacterium]|nr:UDP-glucose 4-epimerase GalE [Candidatus Gastranaerophilales bacterium]